MLRSSPSRYSQRVLCAAVAASFAATVCAQPTGMTPIHGNATLTQLGSRTTVVTVNGVGTQHSAIDWRSFGVPGGSTVFFTQPDAASLSINRVLGGDPSKIQGALGSNGRLVLVNPSGIAIGSGASIDTAGFTASTLAMSRSDAVAGLLRFGQPGADADFRERTSDKKLEADGKVIARRGDVVLISREIEVGKGAILEAQGGDVVLAAGRTVELTGRGLEGIRMQVRSKDDKATNLGTLRGDSVAIFAGQLKHSGVIQAQSATISGGKVVLHAVEKVETEGRIQASNLQSGGSVHISAEKLQLKSATSIDVSHLRGGGEILVGGGWQGNDARIQNARETELEKGVVLKADATLSGVGGTVVVWSEEKTQFEGRISALGAGPGGAGGQVQVSSRGKVEFKGRVDVGVTAGGPLPPAEVVGVTPGGSQPAGETAAGNTAPSNSGTVAGSGASSTSGETASAPAAPTGGGSPGEPAGGSNAVQAQVTTAPRRAPGGAFEPGTLTTVALVPMEGQPEPVVAAMREPQAQNVAYLQATARMQPLSSAMEDPYERKVVITAVQCTVTQ
ncbi:MAG TPA: filamentous hemagglutinin N-terminal domain-containing protein [Ramlibacter sp.]|jgi:filamentous hemagglutinin family protein|nr:filamentous hemagglutinin N-terminal domain-containing protein [Ramlibacter sp.]